MVFLLLNVFLYRCLIESHGTDIVPLGPKVTIPKLLLQICVFIKQHQCALPLEISHKLRYTQFRWNTHQHVYVIRHQMPFYKLYILIRAQLFKYISDAFFVLIINDFSPILRSEHYVVLT